MPQQFTNMAKAELLSAVAAGDTTINLASGGALFPVADAGTAAVSDANNWFKLVLQDSAGYEIAYVRSHASGSDQFTNVLRAQEGTAARAFEAGSAAALRMTAGDMAQAGAQPELTRYVQDTRGATTRTFTRTSGLLSSVNEAVGGKTRTISLTRNASGVLVSVATTYDGKTRTETLTRTEGVLTSTTATES